MKISSLHKLTDIRLEKLIYSIISKYLRVPKRYRRMDSAAFYVNKSPLNLVGGGSDPNDQYLNTLFVTVDLRDSSVKWGFGLIQPIL